MRLDRCLNLLDDQRASRCELHHQSVSKCSWNETSRDAVERLGKFVEVLNIVLGMPSEQLCPTHLLITRDNVRAIRDVVPRADGSQEINNARSVT
jgi:hypothetical protein